MSKKKKKQPTDTNVLAAAIVWAATGQPQKPTKKDQPEKNPAAVALGRLGGQKGGKARAKKLSSRKRREISRKAALARWRKRK